MEGVEESDEERIHSKLNSSCFVRAHANVAEENAFAGCCLILGAEAKRKNKLAGCRADFKSGVLLTGNSGVHNCLRLRGGFQLEHQFQHHLDSVFKITLASPRWSRFGGWGRQRLSLTAEKGRSIST